MSIITNLKIKAMKILAINPGSTSTKIAVFEDEKPQFVENIKHSSEELADFKEIIDQYEYRRDLILKRLKENGIPLEFDAVIGRGGLLKPLIGGVYRINDLMVYDIKHAKRKHACNLGCLLAKDIAELITDTPAFIADPVVIDEMDEVAKLTGSPLITRVTAFHALNQRAVARRFSREKNREYNQLNLIVCHLGGGITVGVHKNGRIIDVNNGLDGDGPFSPERAGTLPSGQLIDLCFSGKFTQEELKKRIAGHAGLEAHLGTTSIPDIIERIKDGDKHAELVLDSMIYNIAKAVGAASTVLRGYVDAILLTGGIAHSDYVVNKLRRRIDFIAPIYVYPGEDEMFALAENALGALRGTLPIQEYV